MKRCTFKRVRMICTCLLGLLIQDVSVLYLESKCNSICILVHEMAYFERDKSVLVLLMLHKCALCLDLCTCLCYEARRREQSTLRTCNFKSLILGSLFCFSWRPSDDVEFLVLFIWLMLIKPLVKQVTELLELFYLIESWSSDLFFETFVVPWELLWMDSFDTGLALWLQEVMQSFAMLLQDCTLPHMIRTGAFWGLIWVDYFASIAAWFYNDCPIVQGKYTMRRIFTLL